MLYDFLLPVSGKPVKWRPLTVGEEMTIAAGHQRPEQQLALAPALVLQRIQHYDGKDRSEKGAPCTLADLKQWDGDDYRSMVEEIEIREGERRAALKLQRAGESSLAMLDATIDALQANLDNLAANLKTFREQARAMEAPASPLEK